MRKAICCQTRKALTRSGTDHFAADVTYSVSNSGLHFFHIAQPTGTATCVVFLISHLLLAGKKEKIIL